MLGEEEGADEELAVLLRELARGGDVGSQTALEQRYAQELPLNQDIDNLARRRPKALQRPVRRQGQPSAGAIDAAYEDDGSFPLETPSGLTERHLREFQALEIAQSRM
jgi:hypothetical protein